MKEKFAKIDTRLAPVDYRRFKALSDELHVSGAELARAAILRYMDSKQTRDEEQRDSKLEHRLKKIEDRYAGLIVRIGVDVGTMMALLSSQIEPAKRRQIMDSAYRASVERFRRKLVGVEGEFKLQISDSQPSETK